MRKFITGLLAAGCIAAVLTGCSSSGGAKETSAPETSAAAAKETESEPAKEAVSDLLMLRLNQLTRPGCCWLMWKRG